VRAKIDASFLGRNVLRRIFGPESEDVKEDENYMLRRFTLLNMPFTKYCWDD
jgi:hypothetical protein